MHAKPVADIVSSETYLRTRTWDVAHDGGGERTNDDENPAAATPTTMETGVSQLYT